MGRITIIGIIGAVIHGAALGQVLQAGFDDLSRETPPAQEYAYGGIYYNGSDLSGGFSSGGIFFENVYNAT
jgi:hypothetical protein